MSNSSRVFQYRVKIASNLPTRSTKKTAKRIMIQQKTKCFSNPENLEEKSLMHTPLLTLVARDHSLAKDPMEHSPMPTKPPS